MLSRSITHSIPRRCCRQASTRAHLLRPQQPTIGLASVASYQARTLRKQQHLLRSLLAIAAAGGAATLTQYYLHNGRLVAITHADVPPSKEQQDEANVLVFEQSRKKPGGGKEENRDMISSQHHQVKQSWENPGVYAWGSNAGRVVAPESAETVVKTPRRLRFFDGKLLRDVKLDRNLGAAIDEQGNLLQWGTGYAPDATIPVMTLKGKNLTSLTLSRDRILALSSNGAVYSVPFSAEEQATGPAPQESSWIPFWTGKSPISYRVLSPKDLAYSEKVTSIASGLEHALLLTSQGRLYSTASASDSFPSRGELGIPGLTWLSRPAGPYDLPHEIITLRGFPITAIACGDHHSLALDSAGRLFSWGDNSSGQLGFDTNVDSTLVDTPSLLPIQKLYAGLSQTPRITSIAAGGSSSYLTIDATRVAALSNPNKPADNTTRPPRDLGRITAETFAFGSGILGQLGNNRWTHVQSNPVRIPSLSSLFEYDETTNLTVPIRLAHLSVGATHAAAVMSNITYTSASASTSDDDTNWGADVVFWGGNEQYQLGTGRRNNVATPTYIQPLDAEAEGKRSRKALGTVGGKEEHRFHVTPRTVAKLGDGRKVEVEQRVHCGRGVSCVYSGT